MTNVCLCVCLKQHRMTLGGVLLAISITACNASTKSHLPAANTSSLASPLIASGLTLSPVSHTQSSVDATVPGQEPAQVIRNYYSAIARRDYKQAYSAWEENGTASHQSFDQFKQGFANTASVAVEIGTPSRLDGAAGSIYIEIPVTVTAVTKNGTRQRFRGSYVLRRINNVPGSTLEQRRWHLYSANLNQAN